MRYTLIGILGALFLINCGGNAPPAESSAGASGGDAPSAAATNAEEPLEDAVSENEAENTFKVNQGTGKAKDARFDSKSKLYASPDETVVQFIVVDRGNEGAPMPGIVVSLTGPDGKAYYTGETDEAGFAEVLVPKGQKYDLVYLSLGRKNINAQVPIPDKPNQTIKLTLRYKKIRPPAPQVPGSSKAEPGFILEGIEFDTGKATIRPGSYERLENVLEFMTHKKSARIQISGHTDNHGKPAANQTLSENRAKAVREYLIGKGIDEGRIEAVGYGQDMPIADNGTPEGRQKNRRIEAVEL